MEIKDINYMSVKEFRKLGFLQELNRQFLHPRGLALETHIFDGGEEVFGGIWDYRNDSEGVLFKEIDQTKVESVAQEFDKHKEARIKKMGHIIQKEGINE